MKLREAECGTLAGSRFDVLEEAAIAIDNAIDNTTTSHDHVPVIF